MNSGSVHVRSYTQMRGGKTVAVSEYDRAAPAATKPIPEITIRKDDSGDGRFGASRRNDDKTRRLHNGVDLLAEPGAPVKSPIDGVIDIHPAYKDPKKSEYQIVSVQHGDDRYRFFYVTPIDADGKPTVKNGDRVTAGQVLGTVQDIAKSDSEKKMLNHIHFEMQHRRQPVDPTPQVEAWQRE